MRKLQSLAVAVSLALATSCASDTYLAELVAAEGEIEEGRIALEALPAPTEEQVAILGEARELEAALEVALRNAERFSRRGWLETTIEGVSRGTSGDYGGLAGLIGVLVASAGGLLVVDKRSARKTSDLHDRIERTLEPQGIAGLAASSAERAASGAAQASRLAADVARERWLAARSASRGLTAPPAPIVAQSDLDDVLGSLSERIG